MVNAVEQALIEIRNTIPKDILEIFFGYKGDTALKNISTEENLLDRIVNGRVRHDIHLKGGRTAEITLLSQYHEPTDQGMLNINIGRGPYALYRIPSEARDGLDILEVHNCRPPIPFGGAGGFANTVPSSNCLPCRAGGALRAVANSFDAGDTTRKPIPQLMSGNMILLNPGYWTHLNWIVVCRLAYDTNMSGLNTASLYTYAQLCAMAVKMYIYQIGTIKIDTAFIKGGAEFESIKNTVDSYQNSEEKYRELLEKFSGTNFLDLPRVAPILKMML